MKRMVAMPERCRVRGCTETNPCFLGGGDTKPIEFCSWLDDDHTLCTNPHCVAIISTGELLEMARIQT